jgi:hypothetical protein
MEITLSTGTKVTLRDRGWTAGPHYDKLTDAEIHEIWEVWEEWVAAGGSNN